MPRQAVRAPCRVVCPRRTFEGIPCRNDPGRRRRGARIMARPSRLGNFAATVEERQRRVAEAFSAPALSVVIPIFNEEDNIRPLCAKLLPALRRLSLRFEIIAVHDGSSDRSLDALKAAAADTPELRILRFR